MKIEQRTVVSLGYTLTVNDEGKEIVVDQANRTKPLTFLFGAGQLLPEFERNIANKEAGDSFDFRLKAEDGYGISDPQNRVMLPLDIFKDEQGQLDKELIKPGVVVPLADREGNHYQAIVLEVNDSGVQVDFNHPLADKELHFIGEVYDVRLATLEELQHGHAHGVGGHHH
jgi:FKBP-type peptidyl-prolyl cis-trans isomerase SlyD